MNAKSEADREPKNVKLHKIANNHNSQILQGVNNEKNICCLYRLIADELYDLVGLFNQSDEGRAQAA
jgi:hypothetical protein